MKKNDFIKVIREVVRQEIKKELPIALAQVFKNLMGDSSGPAEPSVREVPEPKPEEKVDETIVLKQQLREMFSGGGVSRTQTAPVAPEPKKFTSNPVLNEILNQTRPFNSQERFAMRAGGGFVGALAEMPSGVEIAARSMGHDVASATTGVGELMKDEELSFLRNVPGMPGADAPVMTQLPPNVVPQPRTVAVPVQLPENVSALDVRNHPALPENISKILSRDYRSLVRAMDKKK